MVLSRYAGRYGADPVRWLFLTGNKRTIYHLAKEGFRLSVVDPNDQAEAGALRRLRGPEPAPVTHGSKRLILHSSRFVLVGRHARIRAYYLPDDEQSLERLRQNIQYKDLTTRKISRSRDDGLQNPCIDPRERDYRTWLLLS